MFNEVDPGFLAYMESEGVGDTLRSTDLSCCPDIK